VLGTVESGSAIGGLRHPRHRLFEVVQPDLDRDERLGSRRRRDEESHWTSNETVVMRIYLLQAGYHESIRMKMKRKACRDGWKPVQSAWRFR